MMFHPEMAVGMLLIWYTDQVCCVSSFRNICIYPGIKQAISILIQTGRTRRNAYHRSRNLPNRRIPEHPQNRKYPKLPTPHHPPKYPPPKLAHRFPTLAPQSLLTPLPLLLAQIPRLRRLRRVREEEVPIYGDDHGHHGFDDEDPAPGSEAAVAVERGLNGGLEVAGDHGADVGGGEEDGGSFA